MNAPIHPLHGPNKLKLGVFGMNATGTVMTTHPDRHEPTWERTRDIARYADQAGFEAIVPYSRWHSFGSAEHASGRILDPFVWGGALAAETQRSSIFSTMHVQASHPILAAKQGATIDLISNGRFTLNVVVGWYTPELAMFGPVEEDKNRRYDFAEEWITILKRLWEEPGGFDHEGEFFQLKDAMLEPKPISRPRPPIMNAGSSGRGREFAAKHADVAFIIVPDPTPSVVAEQVRSYKEYAKQEFGRDLQVWAYGLIMEAESKAAAAAKVDRYVKDHADNEQIDEFIRYQMANHDFPPHVMEMIRANVASGGGIPLFGTAEDIAAELQTYSETGLDGILTTHVDYDKGMRFVGDRVMPLLEQVGLREAVDRDAAKGRGA